MNRDDVIAELRKARAHIEATIRACHTMKDQDAENAVAYRIVASDMSGTNAEIVEAIGMLAQLADTGTELEELGLSVRTFHVLKRSGINTIEELTQKSQNEVIRIRGMGSRSYNEIVEALEARGLQLRRY